MRSSSGSPIVSVPVLSSRTVFAPPRRSSAPAPLTMIPARAALERPATNAMGAARMSGHGVATTMTARPWVEFPEASHAMPASDERERQEVRGVAVCEPGEVGPVGLGRADEPDDRGVRALGRSGGDPEVEGVTGVRRSGAHMPVARDGDGSASPVRADSSMTASPVATTPSAGTISPARTATTSPGRSSSTCTNSTRAVRRIGGRSAERARRGGGARGGRDLPPRTRARLLPTSSERRSRRQGTRRAREPRRSRRERLRRRRRPRGAASVPSRARVARGRRLLRPPRRRRPSCPGRAATTWRRPRSTRER